MPWLAVQIVGSPIHRRRHELLAFARRHIDAGIEFLTPRRPLLILLGGDPNCGRAALAASLAGLAHPAPGARIMRLASPGDSPWPVASATLAAGCSVLVEGAFGDAADQTEAVKLASRLGVSLLPFWVGTLPAKLDARLWQTLDTGQGVLAALTTAAQFHDVIVHS